MKKVLIIKGGYGHRAENSVSVKLVKCGEVCEVSDEEAERLVALAVAEVVSDEMRLNAVATSKEAIAEAQTNDEAQKNESVLNGELDAFKSDSDSDEETDGDDEEVDGHLDKEWLESCTYNELKKLAKDMGVDTHGLKSKADYIDAIASVEVSAKVGAEDPV